MFCADRFCDKQNSIKYLSVQEGLEKLESDNKNTWHEAVLFESVM